MEIEGIGNSMTGTAAGDLSVHHKISLALADIAQITSDFINWVTLIEILWNYTTPLWRTKLSANRYFFNQNFILKFIYFFSLSTEMILRRCTTMYAPLDF